MWLQVKSFSICIICKMKKVNSKFITFTPSCVCTVIEKIVIERKKTLAVVVEIYGIVGLCNYVFPLLPRSTVHYFVYLGQTNFYIQEHEFFSKFEGSVSRKKGK